MRKASGAQRRNWKFSLFLTPTTTRAGSRYFWDTKTKTKTNIVITVHIYNNIYFQTFERYYHDQTKSILNQVELQLIQNKDCLPRFIKYKNPTSTNPWSDCGKAWAISKHEVHLGWNLLPLHVVSRHNHVYLFILFDGLLFWCLCLIYLS